MARLAKGPTAWEHTLTEKDGVWTFTITPKRGEKSFDPINKNGSQRGGRPIVAFLPKRVKDVKISAGADWKPEITDDFILVPNPQKCDPSKTYRVVFRATSAP
jgi:zinc protease